MRSSWSLDVLKEALQEDGRFGLVKQLGQGSFGCVCLAKNLTTEEVVAIKLLPLSEVTSKYVESELVNHSLLRHPHIVQFRDVFVTSSFICVVLEYASSGTLHAYVRQRGRLQEPVARWFFQQLAVAVDYCHKKGIANRDIKLDNTLLHSVSHLPLPLLKMCDFGYSKEESKSEAKSKVGSLKYMAPEVLLNVTGKTSYDGKVADIWSCGVMLYVMLVGRYPFDSPSKNGVLATPEELLVMLEQMVRSPITIAEELGLSGDCLNIITRMLQPDPQQRITTQQILQHPWFHTNLPPDAATMNERCLLLGPLPGVPSPQEIRRLVHAARAACTSSSSSGLGLSTSKGSPAVSNSPKTTTGTGTAAESPGLTSLCEEVQQLQPISGVRTHTSQQQHQQQGRQQQHVQPRQQQPLPPLPPPPPPPARQQQQQQMYMLPQPTQTAMQMQHMQVMWPQQLQVGQHTLPQQEHYAMSAMGYPSPYPVMLQQQVQQQQHQEQQQLQQRSQSQMPQNYNTQWP